MEKSNKSTAKINVTAEVIVDKNGKILNEGKRGPIDPLIEITDKDRILKGEMEVGLAILLATEILSTMISYSKEFREKGIIAKQIAAVKILDYMKTGIGKSLLIKDELFGRRDENEDN